MVLSQIDRWDLYTDGAIGPNSNNLTLTGTVASVNADLATLIFVPSAGLTPTTLLL